ncbi:hypothetical protein YB2330_003542 [Saitoella coloradoensis]
MAIRDTQTVTAAAGSASSTDTLASEVSTTDGGSAQIVSTGKTLPPQVLIPIVVTCAVVAVFGTALVVWLLVRRRRRRIMQPSISGYGEKPMLEAFNFPGPTSPDRPSWQTAQTWRASQALRIPSVLSPLSMNFPVSPGYTRVKHQSTLLPSPPISPMSVNTSGTSSSPPPKYSKLEGHSPERVMKAKAAMQHYTPIWPRTPEVRNLMEVVSSTASDSSSSSRSTDGSRTMKDTDGKVLWKPEETTTSVKKPQPPLPRRKPVPRPLVPKIQVTRASVLPVALRESVLRRAGELEVIKTHMEKLEKEFVEEMAAATVDSPTRPWRHSVRSSGTVSHEAPE